MCACVSDLNLKKAEERKGPNAKGENRDKTTNHSIKLFTDTVACTGETSISLVCVTFFAVPRKEKKNTDNYQRVLRHISPPVEIARIPAIHYNPTIYSDTVERRMSYIRSIINRFTAACLPS